MAPVSVILLDIIGVIITAALSCEQHFNVAVRDSGAYSLYS